MQTMRRLRLVQEILQLCHCPCDGTVALTCMACVHALSAHVQHMYSRVLVILAAVPVDHWRLLLGLLHLTGTEYRIYRVILFSRGSTSISGS